MWDSASAVRVKAEPFPLPFLIFFLLCQQGERGIPGRKGAKGQKGEPGPPGLDQPCPVVRLLFCSFEARVAGAERGLQPGKGREDLVVLYFAVNQSRWLLFSHFS